MQAATRFMPPRPAHLLPARAACRQSGTPRQSRLASCGHRQPSRAAGLGWSGERKRQHAHVPRQELAGTTGQMMLGTPSRPCCLPPQAPLGAPLQPHPWHVATRRAQRISAGSYFRPIWQSASALRPQGAGVGEGAGGACRVWFTAAQRRHKGTSSTAVSCCLVERGKQHGMATRHRRVNCWA